MILEKKKKKTFVNGCPYTLVKGALEGSDLHWKITKANKNMESNLSANKNWINEIIWTQIRKSDLGLISLISVCSCRFINYGRGRNGNKIMINIYRARKLKWKAGCGMYLKPWRWISNMKKIAS